MASRAMPTRWLLNGVLRGEWNYEGAVVAEATIDRLRELVTRHHLADVKDATERR